MYRRVATIAPDLPNGHMNLGLALLKQRRFGEAEQSLLHALRLRKSPRLLMIFRQVKCRMTSRELRGYTRRRD
jgi:uncharacterized protein HemY